MIADYEAETISKYNLVYETTNFSKGSKQRQCVEYAQILMNQSQYIYIYFLHGDL